MKLLNEMKRDRFWELLENEMLNHEYITLEMLKWLSGNERVDIAEIYLDYEGNKTEEAEELILEDAEYNVGFGQWIDNIYLYIGGWSFDDFLKNLIQDWDIEGLFEEI